MRAAVMEAVRQPLVVKEMPDPECPSNGVVLRSEAEGICRSDWHCWSGDWFWIGLVPAMPLVMGHEFCGVIEEVGKDVHNFKKGQRVLVPFSQGDGICEYCRSGNSNVCGNAGVPGFTYSGGYGRYVAIPHADVNLVLMPDGVDFLEGASMGCRFMTSYHGIVDRAQVKPGEWVAVHGCGGIGLSAVHVASAIGANVVAVDLDERKLELARKMGAQFTVNAKKAEDVAMAVFDITHGGAHVSVDALGIATTCRNSILSLRKLGTRPSNWSYDLRREGRGGAADRPDGAVRVATHRVARDAGDALSFDVADGRSEEAPAPRDDHRDGRPRRRLARARADDHLPERRRVDH
jgi:D-arabinose 1-dehydrogenase-like Zn-dependent alcohol dehydrogenase